MVKWPSFPITASRSWRRSSSETIAGMAHDIEAVEADDPARGEARGAGEDERTGLARLRGRVEMLERVYMAIPWILRVILRVILRRRVEVLAEEMRGELHRIHAARFDRMSRGAVIQPRRRNGVRVELRLVDESRPA